MTPVSKFSEYPLITLDHWKRFIGNRIEDPTTRKNGKVIQIQEAGESIWITYQLTKPGETIEIITLPAHEFLAKNFLLIWELPRPTGNHIKAVRPAVLQPVHLEPAFPKPAVKQPVVNQSVVSIPVKTQNLRQIEEMKLEEDIASFVADYRVNTPDAGITARNVSEWVNQFAPYFHQKEDKLTLLVEMRHLLGKYYKSKRQTKATFDHLFRYLEVYWGRKRKTLVEGVKITNFVTGEDAYGGSSRHDMINLFDELLQEKYQISHQQCSGSETWFYIDDCLYSGERLCNEVLDKSKPWYFSGQELIAWFPYWHSSGNDHFTVERGNDQNLVYMDTEVLPNIRLILDEANKIDNRRIAISRKELFWPKNVYKNIKNFNGYLENLTSKDKYNTLFRPDDGPDLDHVFSSESSRNFVEDLFFRVGFDIVNKCNVKEKFRPLGFDHLATLGFGSLHISYRNIATNCPLALWYEVDCNGFQWKPLFKRKTNKGDPFNGK